MKYILLFFVLFTTNCATMAVYDLMYPNTWKMSTTKKDIEAVNVISDKKIQFKLKGWFGENSKCFLPYDGTNSFQLYAYSVKDCPEEMPIADNVSLDNTFKPNYLPVLNHQNTILDLSSLDRRSYYIYPANLSKLIDLELKEVFYDKKKHKLYLITNLNYCTILGRNEYGDKIGQYSVDTNWEINKSECINDTNRPNLIPIPFFKNNKFTIYLLFKEGAYSVYSSTNIFGGKEKLTYLVNIYSLEEQNNYAYAALFPFAIVFDIVTSPFQIFYLFILGASLPPR